MPSRCRGGIAEERSNPQPMMIGMEKSDSVIVAVKSANKGTPVPAEPMEPRTEPKGNPKSQRHAPDTGPGKRVTGGPIGYGQFVQREPGGASHGGFSTISRLTRCAGRSSKMKKNAAAGVDGMTWRMYEEGLEGRLADLHDRVHSGAYRARPSRRVNIPKPGWRHTTARRCGHRGQDRPEGRGGDYPDADLRGGIPGVQLRVPARAWDAQRARCARGRNEMAQNRMGGGTVTSAHSSTRYRGAGLVRLLEHRIGDRRVIQAHRQVVERRCHGC